MAKRALSWRRAAAIGWRDLKSAPGKFCICCVVGCGGSCRAGGRARIQRELQANPDHRGAVVDGRRLERAHFSRADCG